MPDTKDGSYGKVTQAQVDRKFRGHDQNLADPHNDARVSIEGWDLRPIDLSAYDFHKVTLKKVNLAGKDLRNVQLNGVEFHQSDLSNANLNGATLGVHTSTLYGCDLTGADFRRTELGARFYDCTLDGTKFDEARFHDVTFTKKCRGAATQFVKCRFFKVEISACVLNSPNFHESCIDHLQVTATKILKGDFSDTTGSLLRVRDSRLQGCHFDRTKIGHCEFKGSKFVGSFFVDAMLRGANLGSADLTDADLRGAMLEEADLGGAIVDHANFTGATGLFGRNTGNLSGIKGTRRAHFGKKKDRCTWEFLRKVGRIPLFGVSNVAIIAILVVVAGARWYNAQVEAWQIDPRFGERGQLIQNLQEVHLPWHVGVTLFAIVLLAGASGIYKYRCPEEIDHYSSTEWDIAHSRPLITYFSLSHSQKVWRRLSDRLYLFGVGWTVLYLAVRIAIALHFLLIEPAWKLLRSLWLAA